MNPSECSSDIYQEDMPSIPPSDPPVHSSLMGSAPHRLGILHRASTGSLKLPASNQYAPGSDPADSSPSVTSGLLRPKRSDHESLSLPSSPIYETFVPLTPAEEVPPLPPAEARVESNPELKAESPDEEKTKPLPPKRSGFLLSLSGRKSNENNKSSFRPRHKVSSPNLTGRGSIDQEQRPLPVTKPLSAKGLSLSEDSVHSALSLSVATPISPTAGTSPMTAPVTGPSSTASASLSAPKKGFLFGTTKTTSQPSIYDQQLSPPSLTHSSSSHYSFDTIHRPGTPASVSGSVKETKELVRDYDPSTGNKMINHYMIIKEIGRGSNGKVKLAEDTLTHELWAIKIVEKNRPRNFQSLYQKQRESEKGEAINPQLEKIRKEIAILKKCDHPHVVKLKEVIDDPAAEKIYLVLEYVAGSDVHWRRGDFDTASPVLTLDESRRIFRDVLCGVQYLHFQGIVHRDIKPANLLQTPTGRIKISDFGVSVFIRPKVDGGLKKKKSTNTWSSETSEDVMPSMGAELAKTQGSPAFLAPELCAIGEDYYALMKSKSFYEKDQSSVDIESDRSLNGQASNGNLSFHSAAHDEAKAPEPPLRSKSSTVSNGQSRAGARGLVSQASMDSKKLRSVSAASLNHKPSFFAGDSPESDSEMALPPTPAAPMPSTTPRIIPPGTIYPPASGAFYSAPSDKRVSPGGDTANVGGHKPPPHDKKSNPSMSSSGTAKAPNPYDASSSDVSTETLDPEEQQLKLGKGIDVWAIGVTLYCLVFGKLPFFPSSGALAELYSLIVNKELEFPGEHPVPDELKHLFRHILDKNPNTRLTIEQIKQHPWTTADMTQTEREQWLRETDPDLQYGEPVTVTEKEVLEAVNIMGRIRHTIKKVSNTIAAGLSGLTSRRDKSEPSPTGLTPEQKSEIKRQKQKAKMEEMQKLLSAIESASLTNRSVAHPAPAAAAPHRRLLDADDTHHNPPQMTNPVVGLQLADLSAGVPMRHSQSMYSRQPVNARPSRPNLPEKIRTQSLQTSNLDQDHKIMSPKSPTATSRVSSLFVNMTTGRHAPSSPHPTLTRAATVIPSTPTTPQVVGFESIPQVLQTSLPTKLSFHSALAGRSAAAPAMAIRQPTSSSELLPNPHSHAISASAPNPRPVHPDTPRAASLHIAESNDQLRIISPKWLRWLPGKLDESMLVDPSQGSFVDSQVPLSPTVDHHLDDEDPVQLEKERVKQWHQQYTDET